MDPSAAASSLAAGADSQGAAGPEVTVGPLPASPHPVLAAFGFKSVEGTVVVVDSVEGAAGSWTKVYEPPRDSAGGVSLWIGQDVSGGPVTVTFSGPLERGRLGWTFDAVAGLDPEDPFVQIEQSPMSDATQKEIALPTAPDGPVYGFVMVGRGREAGAVQALEGMALLGRGEGAVLNVASLWSETPVPAVGASWQTPASNVVIAAELRVS